MIVFFSKAAWGETQLAGKQFFIRSYELGVLFLPSQFAVAEQMGPTLTVAATAGVSSPAGDRASAAATAHDPIVIADDEEDGHIIVDDGRSALLGKRKVPTPSVITASTGSPASVRSLLASGDVVILHGLQVRPEMNGLRGVLESFDADKQRWKVALYGGAADAASPVSVAVLAANLHVLTRASTSSAVVRGPVRFATPYSPSPGMPPFSAGPDVRVRRCPLPYSIAPLRYAAGDKPWVVDGDESDYAVGF
jgi:hypothetical protein